MEENSELHPAEVQESYPETYNHVIEEVEKLIDVNEDESDEHTDYTALSKEEVLAKAEATLHAVEVRKASETLNRLKEVLDLLEKAELPAQIKAWTEAGNDPRDFKPSNDETHARFNKIMQLFREKREEERRRAEEEKLANLRKKEAVIEKMMHLVSSEENENSLKNMRDLMREWKEIRHVPKEFQEDLFKRYRFYVEKFYDNLSIFNELKDLDREKNLEIKIELIKKVEALKAETNLRKALVTLNKYHEDWKNVGPVRKEISDEVWNRFKAASDVLLSEKRAAQEALEKGKEANLSLKKLLVEKAENAVAVLPQKAKDWGNLAKELDTLMDEWKKIGPVPKAVNVEIWNTFRAARTVFFEGRRNFFKDLNASREDNLAAKIALCEKAEKMMNAEEFTNTANELNKLQDAWKKIGPVPEAKNDEVWKRFRKAFDHFYSRKNAFFEDRRSQEADAVKEKEAVITELESLRTIEDGQEVFKRLKEGQLRWAKSGFVSGKTFYNLQRKYQEISDFLFAKFKKSSEEIRDSAIKDHYEVLSSAPDGRHKIQGEERKLRDRIQKLQDEVATIENNKNFFAHSKNAGEVLKQFDSNIEKTRQQIERLEKELKVLRSFKNQNAK
jgi:hypothetical protein